MMTIDPHRSRPAGPRPAGQANRPEDLSAVFAREGYLRPFQLFTPAECERIADYLRRDDHPASPNWPKGRAVRERFLYELATSPVLLRFVTTLLGEDVVLWGASAVSRRPRAVHPWHSDIESSRPEGRFVSAWIGVEHTSRESALQLITRSHRLGRTVQEVRSVRRLQRQEATAEAMLAAARDAEPEAELIQPAMTNGDCLLFDGRLWHGSDNARKRGRRVALLFQYAAADQEVRIPDPTQVDWPFRLFSSPRPPVIAVSGRGEGDGVNRVVPPPAPSAGSNPMVSTALHRFVLPLGRSTEAWTRLPAFRGPTRTLAEMGCHASVLAGGHSPHPPHAHREEELLIPLHGAMELVIARGPGDPAPRIERIAPGGFVYYPAGQHHTIRNPEAGPAGYLMLKWHAETVGEGARLGTEIVRFVEHPVDVGGEPIRRQGLLQGPTGYVGKLRAHLTVLEPGAGYEPHVDAYDVAIVLLSGKVETLGEQLEPPGVIYYAAGESHGIRNVGIEPARYLVFEFREPGARRPVPVPSLPRRVGERVIRLARGMAARLAWPRQA